MEERGPIEAGLGWCCKEDTGFIGADAVRAVREAGPREKLVPFTLTGAGIARQGNPVVGGGEVTSGTLSPCLERRHRHGLRARRARAAAAPSSRSTCAARSAPPWWAPSRSTARRTMADASYPDDLLYHPEHDWVRLDGDTATFGITWFAQDALGEVVFFEPPEVGSTVSKDEPYAEVESVKAVSDVIAPLSGEIVEVNTALADKPEAINEDPYGEGWLVRVKLSDPGEKDGLLDAAAYTEEPFLSRAPTRRQPPRTSRRCSPRSASRSLEELFDRQIPAAVRLRPRARPAGRAWPSRTSTRTCATLAARNTSRRGRDHVPRRRDVRPLRPGGHRHADGALGVPDALHALPARDLPGRPAGDVRVPDGDQRADRAAGLQRVASTRARAPSRPPAYLAKLANGQPRFVVSRGRAPARARRRCARYAAGYGARGRRGGAARRRHRPRRLGRRDRRGHERGLLPAAQLPRRGRGRRGAGGRRQGLAARSSSAPTTRSRSASSSRRASAASTSPSARARRSATAWTSAARRSASSPPPRPTCAGCPGASPARRATSTAAAASC